MNLLNKLVFVPGRPLQPSIMSACKTGAYSSGAPFNDYTTSNLLDLTANIRPGWKSLPGTNTLAYYKDS
jgi:hypothetical protein